MSDYYRFPLAADPAGTETLLRVEARPEGAVRVHLHTSHDRRAFGVRFGYAEPLFRPEPQPRETLRVPAADEAGQGDDELVRVGELLSAVALGTGAGETYPWPFDGLMANDEWLLHLRVVCGTHERLAPARASDVFHDRRVQEVVEEVIASAAPHADALGAWLGRACEMADDARAALEHEVHESKVRAVLRALGAGLEEDTGARPNPTLQRIRPVRPDTPDGRG